MAATKDYSKIRFWLRVAELVFSLIVLITGCVWVDAVFTSNINFCIFVSVTTLLLCPLFMYISKKKSDDRGFLTIELGLTILYWIFWLSAAAASAATVSEVNSWYSVEPVETIYGTVAEVDCSQYFKANDIVLDYCNGSSRKGSVRTCCAFAWLTWGLWTASLVLQIIEDVMGPKRLLSSKPAPAAPTGAPAAAPAAPAAADMI